MTFLTFTLARARQTQAQKIVINSDNIVAFEQRDKKTLVHTTAGVHSDDAFFVDGALKDTMAYVTDAMPKKGRPVQS